MLHDIMPYYHFQFFMYYGAAAVPLCNLIGILSQKSGVTRLTVWTATLSHFLILAGMLAGCIFQGVLADNAGGGGYSTGWLYRLIVLGGVTIVLSVAYLAAAKKRMER